MLYFTRLHYTTTTTPLHLHYNYNYNCTTLQLQLQLYYTTLHPAFVVEVTTATTAKSTTPAAVHQWIRSAIHAWQQLLCGTTGKSLFKNGGFPVRKLLNGQRGTNQVATKPAKCYVFSSQCHGTTCLPEEQHLRPCYGWPTWSRSPGNPHGYVVKHNMFYGPHGAEMWRGTVGTHGILG